MLIIQKFHFKITDAEGLWGSLRVYAAADEVEAQACCRRFLEGEVDPFGSLLHGYHMEAWDPKDDTL